MTQVVTVSANTAAYAMETLKPSQRVSGNTLQYEQTRMLHEEAAKSTDNHVKALVNVIKPPSLALYFLTSGSSHQRQASLKEVMDAYNEAGA
ncbi:hypothetical protein MRS76_15015 [Rhizobiaceae bacterium n13]|uniref:Uncharacterized protein n=1 Tax=Ferirhizobium litorale TaxID=2927786 RepID=A0AAE3QGY8_9HYPH|nr:hypothetical protein [Fererhizobium litorale]MDI7863267.1 hypothetical protein [Fererhizobium litorale]MDI7922999.1 hypothetical protein [Fererhizobium litorale]